jgi:hypothetical protein
MEFSLDFGPQSSSQGMWAVFFQGWHGCQVATSKVPLTTTTCLFNAFEQSAINLRFSALEII